jgi:hypothetical protein
MKEYLRKVVRRVYADVEFSWAVLEDFFRLRVLRAPDLTVVPSRGSPADLAGKHELVHLRQSVSSSRICFTSGRPRHRGPW